MKYEDATKLYNDEIAFLDTIDILELIEENQDLWDLMDIIEEKYSKDYYEGVIFNCISTIEFQDYLEKRYGNEIFILEHTRYNIHFK